MDPKTMPGRSPYEVFGNNPVLNVDPMGDDWYKNAKGVAIWRADVNSKTKLGEGEKYIGKRIKHGVLKDGSSFSGDEYGQMHHYLKGAVISSNKRYGSKNYDPQPMYDMASTLQKAPLAIATTALTAGIAAEVGGVGVILTKAISGGSDALGQLITNDFNIREVNISSVAVNTATTNPVIQSVFTNVFQYDINNEFDGSWAFGDMTTKELIINSTIEYGLSKAGDYVGNQAGLESISAMEAANITNSNSVTLIQLGSSTFYQTALEVHENVAQRLVSDPKKSANDNKK